MKVLSLKEREDTYKVLQYWQKGLFGDDIDSKMEKFFQIWLEDLVKRLNLFLNTKILDIHKEDSYYYLRNCYELKLFEFMLCGNSLGCMKLKIDNGKEKFEYEFPCGDMLETIDKNIISLINYFNKNKESERKNEM